MAVELTFRSSSDGPSPAAVQAPDAEPIEAGQEPPEYNIRILWCPATFIAERVGLSALEEVAKNCGLRASDFNDRSQWISCRQLNRFFQETRRILGSDEAFAEACVYRLKDAYSQWTLLLWATSPKTIWKLAAKGSRIVMALSKMEVQDTGRAGVQIRYTTPRPESRLACLSRRVQMAAFPTLWNLPPARLSERGCIARGDEACVYDVEYLVRHRWLWAVLGAVMGALVASLASRAGMHSLAAWIALPALGAALIQIWELARTYRANLAVSQETQAALEQIAKDEAEARQEVMAFGQRQRQWTQMLEEQVQERTQAMQDVVSRIQKLREERATNLRGFSHDLRNPLAVLKSNAEYLRDYANSIPEGEEVLSDIAQAAEQMEQMLAELMETASSETAMVQYTAERIEIDPLIDRLRRRMRALVHGRDIRVSVFGTREAPDHITGDPLVLDRILDNLMTNAAKYTEHGSIVLEVSGAAESFAIKISDTGRGIAPEMLDKIFSPGGSEKSMRAANSYGVGLSVVVKLLAQLGGTLDVMSTVGQGTTFWVNFPLKLPPAEQVPAQQQDMHQMLAKVVKIRRPSIT